MYRYRGRGSEIDVDWDLPYDDSRTTASRTVAVGQSGACGGSDAARGLQPGQAEVPASLLLHVYRLAVWFRRSDVTGIDPTFPLSTLLLTESSATHSDTLPPEQVRVESGLAIYIRAIYIRVRQQARGSAGEGGGPRRGCDFLRWSSTMSLLGE